MFCHLEGHRLWQELLQWNDESEGQVRIVQKEMETQGKEVEAVVCLGSMNVHSVFRVMGNVYDCREKRQAGMESGREERQLQSENDMLFWVKGSDKIRHWAGSFRFWCTNK